MLRKRNATLLEMRSTATSLSDRVDSKRAEDALREAVLHPLKWGASLREISRLHEAPSRWMTREWERWP